MAYNKEFSDSLKSNDDYNKYMQSFPTVINSTRGKIVVNVAKVAAIAATGFVLWGALGAWVTDRSIVDKLVWTGASLLAGKLDYSGYRMYRNKFLEENDIVDDSKKAK